MFFTGKPRLALSLPSPPLASATSHPVAIVKPQIEDGLGLVASFQEAAFAACSSWTTGMYDFMMVRTAPI